MAMIYIGPTVRRLGLYTNMIAANGYPPTAKDFIEANAYAARLFVAPTSYNKAIKELGRAGSLMYEDYKKLKEMETDGL